MVKKVDQPPPAMVTLPTKSLASWETELTVFWQPRDNQIKKDRAIISLARMPNKPGFIQVTLNKPKVLFDTSVSILSGFEDVVRLPWSSPDMDEEERKKMSKAERAWIGMRREFDKHQEATGRPPWLYELAYWVCSGWVAWMPYIDDTGGETRFTCPFFDPLTVYPLWSSSGMEVVLRRYYTTVGVARRLAERHGWQTHMKANTLDTTGAKISSLWEIHGGVVYNTVAFDDTIVKPRTPDENFKEIPLKMTPVGGVPEGAISIGDRSFIARIGENIIAPNREIYELLNKWTAFMMQFAQDVAYPGLLDITEQGDEALKPEDVGPGKVHHRKREEPIEVLQHAGPQSLKIQATVANLLNIDEQRGGLPSIVFGSLPFEISGFMGSQLFAAVKYRLNPRLDSMKFIISWTATEMLRQFRIGKFKVKLRSSEAPSDKKKFTKGATFMEEFSSKDMPDVTYVDVKIPLATMVDKAQQMSWARQALSEPAIFSRLSLWEEEFDIQDIDQELKRIDEDSVENLEGVRVIKAVERLKTLAKKADDDNRPEQAAAFLEYAQLLLQQVGITGKGQQQGGGQGGPPSGGLPPEMAAGGGMNPDMMRAMMGAAPPGGQPGARTRGAEAREQLWYPGKKEG